MLSRGALCDSNTDNDSAPASKCSSFSRERRVGCRPVLLDVVGYVAFHEHELRMRHGCPSGWRYREPPVYPTLSSVTFFSFTIT